MPDHGGHDVDGEDREQGERRPAERRRPPARRSPPATGGREQRQRRLQRAEDPVDPHQLVRGRDLRDQRGHRRRLDPGAGRPDRERREDHPRLRVAREQDQGERRAWTAAIAASAPMISHLRFVRSAQTPANTDTIACGRKPNTAASVIDDARLERDRQVPEHGVLDEHRPEQGDRLAAEEQRDVATPVRVRRGSGRRAPRSSRAASSLLEQQPVQAPAHDRQPDQPHHPQVQRRATGSTGPRSPSSAPGSCRSPATAASAGSRAAAAPGRP